jgi:hypothetical protein
VQGETARARKLYERAIAADAREGGIHLNLGILLHSIGESQASAASVRRGLELIGDPHQAYYMLGLSQRPPSDNDRAADASDLKSAEIEELLAAAMADIPTAAKESKSKTAVAPPAEPGKPTPNAASPSATALTVSTRPGGAKASEVASDSHPDIVADRLFWMSRSQSN